MKRLGVWILRLGGWEVTLVLLIIEALVWAVSPNDLEKWCMNNAFGKSAERGKAERALVGKTYSTTREQMLAFDQAIGSVTLRVQ